MKIIQITDTHLVPGEALLNGTDPANQLRRAVTEVCERHADADLLVMTGDLCNDGAPEAYALLREILSPVRIPARLMLGNHDRRAEFQAEFPEQPRDANGFVQSHLDTPFGRLLFLDTHEPGMIGGRYCATRLGWLEEALAGAGSAPVVVFIHHPPVPDGLAHFRNIGLHDAEPLLARLRRHPGGVRHIVFGHIHVPLAGTSPEGFAYSSGQACAHRFITDPNDATPWWTSGNPCYRILMQDELGFRAYSAEVGQERLARAAMCPGP